MSGSRRGFSSTAPPTPSGALPGGKITLTAIQRRYIFFLWFVSLLSLHLPAPSPPRSDDRRGGLQTYENL